MKPLAPLACLLLLVPGAMASSHVPAVANVRVESGNQSLRISWNAVDSDVVVGYRVEVYQDGQLTQRMNTTETMATYRGVNERSYAVRVAALDATGVPGPWSEPAAGTPTLKMDQTYLALGLILVWGGVWAYPFILSRIESRIRKDESTAFSKENKK